jgi:carbamoyl-phosphate synthase large subunit
MNNALRILITGVGAPGIMGTVYSLKNNYDKRQIYLVGTDINTDAVGKYFCDSFYVLPAANDTDNYLDSLLKICVNEKIKVVIPQNTRELLILAANTQKFIDIGTNVLVSSFEGIKNANDKYELMKVCKTCGVPVADFKIVKDSKKLVTTAKEFGWPKKKIVVKPPSSNGQRGVRIIDEKRDLKKAFYNEKPSSLYTTLNDLEKVLGSTFPELIVTEYLPGEEYTVDVIRKGKLMTVIPRKRDLIRSGITFNGSVENNLEIINYSKKLAEVLNLEYCFGFQFKLDENNIPKILESNPRVQGTMVLSTIAGANIIYSSVKLLLGEEVKDFEIDWNSKIFRYWGGVGLYKGNSFLVNY